MFNVSQCQYKKEIYRKAIHLSSLWMPIFIYYAPQKYSLFLFGIGFVLNTLVEYANYKRLPWARKSFGRIFAKTMRPKETGHAKFRPTGSMYVLSAAFICTWLFTKEVAVIAMSVMLISDTIAALIGKKYGSHKIYKQKSWEGTMAFFLSAVLVNLAFSPVFSFTYAAILSSFAATVAELYEDKLNIDDNLSIPLICGLVLTHF